MIKLTQPHLSMNNMFPPINTHSRPPSEDLRGGGGPADIRSASKQQHIRRQHQTMDQQRRSPLRSNSLLTPTSNRYVTTAAAATAAAVAVPSSSSFVRSATFVQPGSSAQSEPAKIIYRSNDYAWNDHPSSTHASNQPLRVASPIKAKISTSARHLANGILHEGTASSMLHLPTSSSPTGHYQQHTREDTNNADLHLSFAAKSRHTTRLQRTNSHLDKAPGTNGHGIPIRSESYRSSRLDYGMRGCNTSSKQRNYINSKTSFHDINPGDFYVNGTQDENSYYQQPQPQQINPMSSTQRLNGSTLDLTSNRKLLSPNKSNTFNAPPNGTGHHTYYNSSQEVHRTETTADRNNLTRFGLRGGTTSKEQLITTPKYRQTSIVPPPTVAVAAVATAPTSNTPGERHPSAQSYKSRDANISYAYTDVKKYIEENELMSPEKENIIQSWIIDVEKYRHQLQKIE